MSKDDPKEEGTGPVSVEEAREIAQRFIDGHFREGPDLPRDMRGIARGEGPRISIPADPKRDDDIRLVAFIQQIQGELEELRKRVAYCEERHRTMSHVESPEDIRVDTELEDDGRWIAEVDNVRGALAYGDTREEAVEGALRVALAEALRQLAKEG